MAVPPDYPGGEAAISVMPMRTCLTKVTTGAVEDRGHNPRVWGEKRIGAGPPSPSFIVLL